MIFCHPKGKIIDWFRNHPKYQKLNIKTTIQTSEEKLITVVTTCMDRLRDLKQTLPKNLEDNKNYKNAKFIVLDYSSKDGLDKWIKSEMMEFIKSGRLDYYRSENQKYFRPNHSRNVTFRLAKGLVANVDADNFMHPNYLKRLNDLSSTKEEKILIVPENFLLPGSTRLHLKGRFAMHKKDIELLGGFDEDLDEGFGNDDINFVLRAMLLRFSIARFESFYTDNRLPTTDDERVSLVKNKDYRKMRDINMKITTKKIQKGVYCVNKNKHWGEANLIKNFSEKIKC